MLHVFLEIVKIEEVSEKVKKIDWSRVAIITSDLDWCPDDALENFLDLVWSFQIPVTLFTTHHSDFLKNYVPRKSLEIGAHPNFLPGSSHGNSIDEILNYFKILTPNAIGFRSHCYVDSSMISQNMVAEGFLYDSNLILDMCSNIIPQRHGFGQVRFPVFWEDDLHWTRNRSWNFENFKPLFQQHGMKVLNVHPFIIALNIQSAGQYLSVKKQIKNIDHSEIKRKSFLGYGSRDFFCNAVDSLSDSGYLFMTMGEACRRFTSEDVIVPVT